MTHQWQRLSAGAAALTGPAGGVLMAIGVSALPHPWTTGYVSEAGGPGARLAGVYETGVVLLAMTLVLLGLALGPLERVVLLIAGVLAAVSSQVSCTANCPLPPYEHTTAQDLVHAGSSTTAIGLTTLAMLILASRATPERTLARIGFVICAPLLFALAVALLVIGRGMATAILERVALVAVLGWVQGCALGLSLRGRRPAEDPTKCGA